MRIGLFGGTFDPIHYGHLILAECCREQCRLDQVLFLPTAVPPHKRGRVLTPGAQRLTLIEAAIAGNSAFSVSRYEVDQGGVNYSVDTLRHFQRQYPNAELFFVMGADMLNDLPNWREAHVFCDLATPIVACRPDTPLLDFDVLASIATPQQVAKARAQQVQMPPIGISSTQIRQRIAAGESVRYQTPPEVLAHIRAMGLYRADA